MANVEPSHKLLIFRKFAYLQARVILDKQAELVDLERQLRLRDIDDTVYNATALKCRLTDQQREDSTVSLLKRIEASLDGCSKSSWSLEDRRKLTNV